MLGSKTTLKESTLQAKLRRYYKAGKSPHDAINLHGLEVVQDSTPLIYRNTVAHYTILNPMTDTLPSDFMNRVENTVTLFLKEHPNNKFQLGLVQEVSRENAKKGEYIYETTNLEKVYQEMKTRIVESLDTL